MEQFLKYFYNIYVDKVYSDGEKYYFYLNGSLYHLVDCFRTKEEINDISNICSYLLTHNFPVSELILNNRGEYISLYENNNYILLKINCTLSKDIDINDIIKMNNILTLNGKNRHLYRNNWGELWESKVDYFEYQVKELGLNKSIILNSFSYYIGLAENAISIANITMLSNTNDGQVTLSHKRIHYPNMEIDFFNPLNFIFDLKIRDISEYFKSMFFYTSRSSVFKQFANYLSKVNLSNFEANMLFARLLYPSYYFDIYEKVIENKKDEDELLDIVNKVDEYELFLKDVYSLLSKNHKIEQIGWLLNKKKL